VTTAQSGSRHWFSEHANDPFDVVIIDEISKATPPEIILASLLGRKVIWVGDHRQLLQNSTIQKRKHRRMMTRMTMTVKGDLGTW